MSKHAMASVERIVELLTQFKLPTLAAELPARFGKDGQQEALGLVLELLEMEAGDRRQRRVERLQRDACRVQRRGRERAHDADQASAIC